MKTPDCVICRAPNRRRLIEADWADGMSAAGISKVMADAGWSVGAPTILKHLKEHAAEGAAIRAPIGVRKRDAAIFVRDRLMDRIEELESGEGPKRMIPVKEDGETVFVEQAFDILDPTLQPALGTLLKAQGLKDKAAIAEGKRKIDLFRLMLGGAGGEGALAPLQLSSGEDVIDGVAVEVDDDDAEEE